MILISPNRADINAQLNYMKPALNRMPDPKTEFIDICEAVKGKQASFYQMKLKDRALARFVGVARGTDYFIWALAGNGLFHIAPEIIKRVSMCGYQSISINTFKVGMVAMLKKIGFTVQETIEHQSITEYVMTLDLK